MTEQYRIQYGLPCTILRSSWVFEGRDLLNHFSLLHNLNPEEKGHSFGEVHPDILELVRQGAERIPILTQPNGTPLHRHIVHIDDVMQAFAKMLNEPKTIGDSFNIAGPAPFDYREAGQYLSQKTGIPAIEIPCPDYHPFEIDIRHAQSVLGYSPRNDIFRMIDRALEEVI